MLRRRPAVALAVLGGAYIFSGSPASAEDPEFLGRAECGTHGGPGCNVSAESGEEAPGAAAPGGGENGGGSASAGAGGGSPATAEAEPNCEEVALGQQECETTLTEADLDDDAVVAEAPIDVADDARDALELPQPGIAASPALDQPVLVQVPVWLWIDEETWSPESAEAEVPGGSVSVTAST